MNTTPAPHRSRPLLALLLLAPVAACGPAGPDESAEPFDVVEATIPEMQQAMEEGRLTSRELVEAHLVRIATWEERVNAVIAVNPHALEEADRLDRERAEGRVRGPLHGIPVALKDNVHTTDMPTTGGALAFEGFVPPYEATVTENLREAGAIILAKTVMTELANYTAAGMPGNYSAVGGYGLNPYDPRRDPREGRNDGRPVMGVGGSSSGIGTAMSFWAANVGTETSGSILSPSNSNMLAAIKPTVGRISRWGIIPITGDQDTAGPMARTVTDAAIFFGALESAAPDPNDPATDRCERAPDGDYTAFLNAEGLQGARIGIPRALYYDSVQVPGTDQWRGGLDEEERAAMVEAIEVLRAQGAVIVDPADIPSVLDPDPETSLLTNGRSSVLDYGMKRDFNAWLETLGESAPVRTLTELREWNLAHETAGAIKYQQARLDGADEIDLEGDRARYEEDRARDIELNGTRGIDAVMEELDLDALLFPGSGGAGIAARPGYPTVIVPWAFVPNDGGPDFPEGFEPKPRPLGVSFTGTACSEPRLIELAYAFEQATLRRVAPEMD
ncbi:MAG TPA: amidase family protein [Longimicrobiales bacterium]|nr:amidase family protein [Longimicrobiales bacterium]